MLSGSVITALRGAITSLAFIVFCRVKLSSIAHIPGPKLAAISSCYEFYYDVIRPGRYVFKIQDLHKTYGPIIRISPSEIHINDPFPTNTVCAPGSVRRDKYEYQLRTLRIPTAVGAAADHYLHRNRRAALSSCFSKRNVMALESVIVQKVEQLIDIVAARCANSVSVNLSDLVFGFTNDVVTNFCFDHQADLLADIQRSAIMRHNSNQLLLGIKVNQHFPLLIDFLEALPFWISKSMMPVGLFDMMELSSRVRAELEAIRQKMSPDTGLTQQEGKKSIFYSLLSSPALPSVEKAPSRLEQEGTLLVLAGTESPARSLAIIFYHLATNPSILVRLQDELDTVSDKASWSQLEQLPYLSAVIEEGNRLSFGVTARTARIAYEPLTYTPRRPNGRSVKIPPGKPVSITTLSAHTNEEIFPDPYSFDPDRWLGSAGVSRRKHQFAFNHGGRLCLGIELAHAELYLATAALARKFTMTPFHTEPDDVAFHHDYQVAMPKLDSQGVQVLPSLRV